MAKFFIGLILIWCCYANISLLQFACCDEIVESKNISEMQPRSSPIDIDIFRLENKRQLENVSVYNFLMTSTTRPFGDQYGRPTNAHETVHGINSGISKLKNKHRAFYCGKSRCLWIKEPGIKMQDITPYIPDILKGYRYTLYFVTQLKHWNDVALYPVDEWSAYICGAECAVDDHNQKIKSEEKADSVSGALEFSIYCTALGKAVMELDREYWDNYPQFKNSIKFFLIKSEKVFFDGRYIFPSQRQERLLQNLREHKEAEPIRRFLIQEFDGVFIQ